MESPLFSSQRPLWVGQQLHQDSPLYNMAFAFVLHGEIDAAAFCDAWAHVVEANETLRTRFVQRAGDVVQTFVAGNGPAARVLDFSNESDSEAAFTTWAQEACRRPLPLDGPLVESVLARLSDRRYGWYLNQHHLVTDAWATVLLFRQVAAEYAAAFHSDAPRPAALVPYAEAMAPLASFPDPDTRTAAEAYWRNRVRDTTRQARFYGGPGRPAGTRSERRTLRLDRQASARVRALAGEPGFASLTPDISLFTTFATLLAAWLHRVTGQADVGFDAPAHNRPTAAARRALGAFIEMFPFGVQVEPDDSFRALGTRCLAETQRFLRHTLPGTASGSGGPAGNVVLNYFPGTFGTFGSAPVSSTWLHPGASDSVHAVRLQVHDYDGAGAFTLHLDLNEDVLSARRRDRAVAHFERLLAAVLENPDLPLSAIDIQTPDERETSLVRYNRDTGAPRPARTAIARFHHQATLTPARIAVRQGTRTATFAELQHQVRNTARGLVRSGVGCGARVAVLMPRSLEAIVACLAVLDARAAYVPIDPVAPAVRVGRILADSGAALVLVRDAQGASLVPPGYRAAHTRDVAMMADPGVSLPGPLLEDLAYVMYTSGSTGLPKGVLVTHEGLAEYLEWADRQYVRGASLAFPLFTPLTFDLTVTSLYLPLLSGGTVVIYQEQGGPADAALGEVVADNGVDVIKLTPSHLSLLRYMDLSASRISRVIVGGEDFRADLAKDIAEKLGPKVEIYNEYGPTEAVVGCMLHRYDPARDTGSRVPIGRPADRVRLYVLNERGTPVPEGVPGELCISRPGLARGYHNRPDLTDRVFVPDPFVPGGRMYRSGDLVRFSSPDTMEYLGRVDRQVKLSGIRVEPGEIEVALGTHEAVRECVVTARVSNAVDRHPGPVSHCVRCGLPSDYPDAAIDGSGTCGLCRSFDAVRHRVQAYFRTMADLEALFDGRRAAAGTYDAMMLLSGGKDSTYALCRLVDLGLRVYAFSFDNGYISDGAKENIRRVTEALGVQYEIATTAAMPAIFRDSLARFSNVCNGCFKTIYTLAANRALEMQIPTIVTGLSRGQLFETRLTSDLFRDGRTSEDVDGAVLAARKAYHRQEDEVSRRLDVSALRDDRTFERTHFVDFYRYCDVGLSELLEFLRERIPWMRPADTGRSTNCLINDAGIYVHRQERGYHNYALPYSWDVRLGQKTRAEALAELDDRIDIPRVRRILSELGYHTREDRTSQTTLTAYYVASRDIPDAELRRHLASTLPSALMPQVFRRIDAVPLTVNGKVDEEALRASSAEWSPTAAHELTRPEGAVEERIAAIWRDVLRAGPYGTETSFFELGGTSLGAMEVALRICRELDVDLPLQAVFTNPTIARLARHVEALIVEEVSSLSDEDAAGQADRADTIA